MPQIRIYPNEQFKEIEIDSKLKLRYAISNKGRLVSFTDEIQNGRLLKGSLTDGYVVLRYKINKEGELKNKQVFLYKLVAQYFIPKQSEEQTYVLHLDYVRNNDDVNNLRWATRAEMLAHHKKSPHVIQSQKNLVAYNLKADGRKLTSTKVIRIKKILANPEQPTRLKMIAKQFGVSEMQIRRIASGENWGHIKI
ncbi:NUMOD4 domain-containing protein [Flavobacterium sp. 5]|uniref:NUMOD4 domain-containing protein n=1 Tax=Flavobacterium sp. 5 TaxID=2035199 RepID=UPI000C2CB6CC|nr:NUMOD4 domain-containing protein [Flavobacterium sp. 5]PKB15401.1 NUMOD4 motif-containing protein [Flavobacterium sp. 5]